MPVLNEAITVELSRLMSSRHLLMGDPRPGSADRTAEDAITSALARVRLDRGTGQFHGRRRQLSLTNERGSIRLQARTRPLPRAPDGQWDLVEWAFDHAGEKVPICCSSRSSGTLHLLVDLEGARGCRPGEADTTEEQVARILAYSVFERPAAILLDRNPEPRVGSQVATRVRSLLGFRPQVRTRVLRSELAFLLALARDGRLPATLNRRVESLKRTLASVERQASQLDGQRVEQEVARLSQLVRSRACAALWFGDREIRGHLNPRQIGSRHWIKPLAFELQLGRSADPLLHFWNPLGPEPEPGEKFARCLDGSEWIWLEIVRSSDLYGLIDAVLNFVETNSVRIARLDAVPRRRSRARTLLGAVLEWI